MQDLKTGHLLGAAPQAQFWGQVIGATAGAVVSAFIYRLYTVSVYLYITGGRFIPTCNLATNTELNRVYTIPSELYQVPTAYVWIFTARLVTGKGLPYMAQEWALGSAVLFAAFTALRISLNPKSRWQALIPGGIAVAVGKCHCHITFTWLDFVTDQPTSGMYNVPSFTLARTVGGILSWWWRSRMGWEETPLIVLASVSFAHYSLPAATYRLLTTRLKGFILGEGFLNIVNLLMESAGVPHL